METYAIIDTTTTLDKIKDLVSKMNDFEFKFDTNNNRIAYQEYKKQLKEAFNRLRYESWEEYQEANQYIDEHLQNRIGLETSRYNAPIWEGSITQPE